MDRAKVSHKDQQLHAKVSDPYLAAVRPAGLALCSGCGVYYNTGRWTWDKPPANGAIETVSCPACRRIAAHAVAGEVNLSGDFFTAHHDEIVNVIKHAEKMENQEHALERVMGMIEKDKGLLVETTGVHLAGRIGHALSSAFHGETQYHYDDKQLHVRVNWHR